MSAEMIVAIATGIASLLVSWGMIRAKVMDIDKQVELIQKDSRGIADRIHQLRDIYVTQQHFYEMIAAIKESQKEMKDDMKKILELLNNRV